MVLSLPKIVSAIIIGLICAIAALTLGSFAQNPYGYNNSPYVNPNAVNNGNGNFTLRENRQGGPDQVLIILDASDSMNEKMNGVPKFQTAKDTILKTLASLPPSTNVGLRVYGQSLGGRGGGGGLIFTSPWGSRYRMGGNQACEQSELLVPIGPNNRAQIASQLVNTEAVGMTPMTYALQQAIQSDFVGRPGKKTIILVSDGRETCSFDPCDLAVSMVRQNVDIKINTIGFFTRDKVADEQLKCVALSTKGKFYSANTAAELARGLQDSTSVQTSVQAQIVPGP